MALHLEANISQFREIFFYYVFDKYVLHFLWTFLEI